MTRAFPPALKTAVLFVFAALLAPALRAQTFYFGAVEDVYPVGLEVEAHGESRLWVGAVHKAIRLTGACDTEGVCAWRARDTALLLEGALVDGDFRGTLRDGKGRERSVLAKAYQDERSVVDVASAPDIVRPQVPKEWVEFATARVLKRRSEDAAPVKSVDAFPSDFLSYCGSEKSVSTWMTAARDYRLTLARLPGGRLAGSLFLNGPQTTLLADGEVDGPWLEVALRLPDGRPLGGIVLIADSTTGEATLGSWGRLSAKLELGDEPLNLRLALAERIPLTCRQQGGILDLVLPAVGVASSTDRPLLNFEPMTPVDLVDDRWARLAASGKQGHVWFEPVRLDAQVLSGWVHEVTARGHTSTALNIDLRDGTLIGEKRFAVGSKRPRHKSASQRQRRAMLAHPLYEDLGFRAWINGQALDQIALAAEGLVFATERHPVYGQLTWIEPWAELSPELQASTLDLRGDAAVEPPKPN